MNESELAEWYQRETERTGLATPAPRLTPQGACAPSQRENRKRRAINNIPTLGTE